MDQTKDPKDDKKLLDTAALVSGPRTVANIDFDDIIQQIGPFGRSQILVYILTSLFDILLACQLMFFLFGGGNPGWYCIPVDYPLSISNPNNQTLDGYFEVLESRPTGILSGIAHTSYHVRPEWENTCSINGTKCGHIVFKPGSTTIVTEFSLACDLDYVSTFCTTMAMVGILFGAAIGGQLADLFGRRPVFFSIAFCLLLCQFGQSFAVSWQMFAGFRFFAGFLSGGFMVVTYIIPLEVVGHQWRTVCGCIGLWQIGQMIFSGFAIAIPNWRHLSLATTALCSPLLVSWWFIPESPRWLIQKDKISEASKVLTKMARWNRHSPPSESSLKLVKKDTDTKHKYSFLDLFSSREYTKRTLVMFFIWFSCTMTYYGLSISTRDISDNIAINVLIMGFCEIVFVVSVMYSAYRFGRRPALMFYFSVSCACLIAAMALNILKFPVTIQSVLGSLGRGSLSAAWGIAYLLAAELYPTVIRGLACGSCSVAGRVGGILAPQIAYLKVLHPVIPGAVYASSAVAALLLAAIILPETKGTRLPDKLPSTRGCCSSGVLEEEDNEIKVPLELQNVDPTKV